jgi:hypothetical protein
MEAREEPAAHERLCTRRHPERRRNDADTTISVATVIGRVAVGMIGYDMTSRTTSQKRQN